MLAHCYWHRDRTARPTILGLHGLEGSSRAHYMQGLADKAWAAGFNVVLLNQRNCGGTEHLSSTLYHSGLTADADWVLRELAAEGLARFGVVGYSLGGNLALKLAGDYGGAGAVIREGRGRGVAGDGSAALRRCARTAGATSPISGTSCGT